MGVDAGNLGQVHAENPINMLVDGHARRRELVM
jgi:hypothetical protein